jgi:hypothetical protein
VKRDIESFFLCTNNGRVKQESLFKMLRKVKILHRHTHTLLFFRGNFLAPVLNVSRYDLLFRSFHNREKMKVLKVMRKMEISS